MPLVTLSKLKAKKIAKEKFAVLTAYDATFAQLISREEIEVLLVGDSLGMVVQGKSTTVPVTLDEMIYHTKSVVRGNEGSFIMADLPFMTYSCEQQALDSSAALMRSGAQIVKLEGGRWLENTVKSLSNCGIPVCAHIGLTPQSVHKIGGYKIQGRGNQAQSLIDDAHALQNAGADMLLMECVPQALASRITQELDIPTIGIGAGPDTDAQVLVMHDMLGIATDYSPKFVKNFLAESSSVQEAIRSYAAAVKSGEFPAAEHCYED